MRLRGQQVVAQLVRQRPPHRPRQQRLPLHHRHLADDADDAARLFHHRQRVGVRQVDLLLWNRPVVEHDPAERDAPFAADAAALANREAESVRHVRRNLSRARVGRDHERRTPPDEGHAAGTPDRVRLGEHRADELLGQAGRRRHVHDHRRDRRRGRRRGAGGRCDRGEEHRRDNGRGDQHHACNRRLRSSKV